MSGDSDKLLNPRDSMSNWGWSKLEVMPTKSWYTELILAQRKHMRELEAQSGSEEVLYEIVEKEVVIDGKKTIAKVKVYRSTTPMDPQYDVAVADYDKMPVD